MKNNGKMKRKYNFKFWGLFVFLVVVMILGMLMYFMKNEENKLDVLGTVFVSIAISSLVNLISAQYLGESELQNETKKQFELLIKLKIYMKIIEKTISESDFIKIKNKIKSDILNYYIAVNNEDSIDIIEELLKEIYNKIEKVDLEVAITNVRVIIEEIDLMMDGFDKNNLYINKDHRLSKYDFDIDSL